MNLHQAKIVLQAYRPGGQDANEAIFLEALSLARTDPELRRWFAEQRAFDEIFSLAVEAEPAPTSLKAAILEQHITPANVVWWRQPVWQALAAGLVLLAGLGVFWCQSIRPPRFGDYRAELIQAAVGNPGRLDLVSPNLIRIRQWLAERNLNSDVSLPFQLRGLPIVGCRVLDLEGRDVPALCLEEGGHYVYLYIIDRARFRDRPPEDAPQFEQYGSWRTASWRRGDTIYLWAGASYFTFVEKFRKGGQWSFNTGPA